MGLENPLHILMLLLVVLLVFGARRLPEIGRSLGEGMRGFKDSLGGAAHVTALDAPPAADGAHRGAPSAEALDRTAGA
jgi:sec-independent protein translocase protein TatA